MRFTEPGTIRLRITAPGGRTVADGKRTRTVAGKANVTLKVTRRAALRRAKRVTLVATFTPSRAGAKAQGRTVADGKRTRTVAGKANVTLKVTRRAALRRAKRVTLIATFTPAREGVRPARSTTVRLR